MAKNKDKVVWLLYITGREFRHSLHGIYRTKALAVSGKKENEKYFPNCDFTMEMHTIIDEET